MIDIGAKIKQWRKENDCTQRDMVALTGFSLRTLQGWERGEFTPSLEGIVSLARTMGVTTDWLLGMDVTAPAERPQPR